jgi:hypothetical protein
MDECQEEDEIRAAFQGMELSDSLKRGWLCGFFDGEGTVPRTNNRKVSAAGESPLLIKIALRFLKDVGIQARTEIHHKNPKPPRPVAQKVVITGQDELKKFSELIGFREKRKQDTLLAILANYRKPKK